MSRPHPIRWTALACLIVLLAGSGCGPERAPGTTRSSPSTSSESPAPPPTDPAEASPGGTGVSPAPPRTPLPKSSPRALTDDPAAVVRGLLDAIDTEDYATQRTYTAGAVGALVAIRDVIAQENHRRGADTDNRVTFASHPATESTTPTEARVSVQAKIISIVSGEHGKVESEDTISGPVRLRRDDDRWKVVDLVYSGGALEPGYHAVDAKQTREGFTLTVGAVLSYKETTATLIRIVNEDGGRVPLRIEPAVLMAAGGTEHNQTQYAFESSVTPAGFLGFDRVEAKPASLRVPVSRGDNDQHWTFEITF